MTGTPALDVIIDEIKTLVECESPSNDPVGLALSADAVAALGTRLLGFEPTRTTDGGGQHLLWRRPGPVSVMILGHHDTVWPIGSWRSTWTRSDGRISGPGCFDMKAGLVIGLNALSSLAEADRAAVSVLVTSDEEIGAPSSGPLIEQQARDAGNVLVLEASAPGGALKTSRRGIAVYRVEVEGRAAHAGLEPHLGVNSAVELAHQVLAIDRIGRDIEGVTVVPTMISSGTAANTVPAAGTLTVDVRSDTADALALVDERMHALTPALPEARVEVELTLSVPPLEEDASRDLFALARRVALENGLRQPEQVHVGGASDGNRAAAAGARVLDGLGATGGGAHASGEYVETSALQPRIDLVRALLQALVPVGGER